MYSTEKKALKLVYEKIFGLWITPLNREKKAYATQKACVGYILISIALPLIYNIYFFFSLFHRGSRGACAFIVLELSRDFSPLDFQLSTSDFSLGLFVLCLKATNRFDSHPSRQRESALLQDCSRIQR
jgi:hypothetical protein